MHQSVNGHSEGLIYSSTKRKTQRQIHTGKSGLEKEKSMNRSMSASNITLHIAC